MRPLPMSPKDEGEMMRDYLFLVRHYVLLLWFIITGRGWGFWRA